MKKLHLLLLLLASDICAFAGITTYQFNSLSWGSTVGANRCDGKTDGWISDINASEYMTGRTDAEGRLYSQGVSVKTGTSGAGATSVKAFTNIRRIDFNFCQNASKGKGIIYVQVGDHPYDSIIVNKPATSGSGIYMRDSIIKLTTPLTGNIRFWITCSENAINLNTITIRSEDGGSSPFTQSSFQLVTDIHQLQDSDQIIFGVADGNTNMIMGYYDELVSQNNIHAIKGVYSEGRTVVREDDNAIYTLWKETGEDDNDTVYIFQDELRYELAYLVASGGKTKNKLTLWTDVVSPAYGNYGFWRMNIDIDGKAVIENAGTSERKYMQYNANDQLFGCYADPNAQTKVCLYRKVPAIGTDDPAIAVPLVNCGDKVLTDATLSGTTSVTVNAVKLTEDISATLKHANVFSLSTNTLDRDGDFLTISYSVTQPGKYIDTLILSSTDVTVQTTIMIHVIPLLSIAQAAHANDFELIALNTVVVTKKYDKYIFIRDNSGAMLIYDGTNPKTGKPYGQDLTNGHQLSNVIGRFKNYFGVPEIQPTNAWNVAAQTVIANPELVSTVDSADVCRFIRLENATIDEQLTINGIPVKDAFNTGLIERIPTTTDAIVMIDHDQVQLWIVKQEFTTDLESVHNDASEHSDKCTIHNGKFIRNNQLLIQHNNQTYSILGTPIN